jgi:hypothetical protein
MRFKLLLIAGRANQHAHSILVAYTIRTSILVQVELAYSILAQLYLKKFQVYQSSLNVLHK